MFTEFVDMQLKWKATLATLAARHPNTENPLFLKWF